MIRDAISSKKISQVGPRKKADRYILHTLWTVNDVPGKNPRERLPSLRVDTVQDFVIKVGIKTRMNLLEIGMFSLNHVIDGPTKIMNRADKNWACFY